MPKALSPALFAAAMAVLVFTACTRTNPGPELHSPSAPMALQAGQQQQGASADEDRADGAMDDDSPAEVPAVPEDPPAPEPDRTTLPTGWGTVPAPPLDEAGPRIDTGIDHVVILVVDGVRSDAIATLGTEGAPTWHRLMAEGASTLNARTDPRRTYTNPNHLGMITGLVTDGDDGHGLRSNRDVEGTLHDLRGAYLPSVHDVTFHHGLTTAVFASKPKLDLLSRSWTPEHAAPSSAREDNDALRIVAESFNELDDAETHAVALEFLEQEELPAILFLQYSRSDGIGHSSGFNPTPGSAYMRELTRIDGYMAEILERIEQHPALAGRTAVVLTTDHGGEGTNHFNLDHAANWTIPLVVWGPGVPAGTDLHALNAEGRADPGDVIASDAAPPPIRNIEAGQIALRMLGLPPIPGSRVGVAPPLQVFAPAARPAEDAEARPAPPGGAPAPEAAPALTP